jgi:putative transposase
VGAKTAFITPGSPWENGYGESVNARVQDELLNGEVFTTLREAQIMIERWRPHYNTVRPHSALGCRPPTLKSIVPKGRPCINVQTGSSDGGTPTAQSRLTKVLVRKPFLYLSYHISKDSI